MDLVECLPQEGAEVSRFLAEAFATSLDAPNLESRRLQWKYHQPRPDWAGGRSFVLKREGQIAAHAAVWPVRFPTVGGEARGIHLIDWAGTKAMPGAGVLLLRQLSERADFLMTVGGSEATRMILPRLGYQLHAQVETFVRVVRPWQQVRRTPHKDWKTPARLARNLAWSFTPLPALRRSWSVVSVGRFDASHEPLLRASGFKGFVAPRRSAAMLNYMLACPGGEMRAFELHDGQMLRGFFLLSRVLGQARIADLLVNSELPDEWMTAVSAAAACASQDREACELAAHASIPLIRQALIRCGFRARARLPVFILDPRGTLPSHAPLYVQMLDGDAAFLATPESPFLS